MNDNIRVVLVVLAAVLISGAVNHPQLFKRDNELPGGFSWEGQTVPIATNQMLYVQHRLGQALVDFTDCRPNEAYYRFRFKSAATGTETNGTGQVCIDLVKSGRESMSWETKPWIHAGALSLMWTNSGPNSATVFYHSNRTHVAVLSDAEFETFDFGKGNLSTPSQEEPFTLSSALNSVLWLASDIMLLSAVVLLFMRLRLTFLIYLIISGAMLMTYIVVAYSIHFFPSGSYSHAGAAVARTLHTCGSIIWIVGLSGCIAYLLKGTK